MNDSTETLVKVSTEAYGFIKDAIINNNPSYTYANVQPKESVKIEHYDEILDCDYVLGLDIYIEFQNGSKIKIRPRNLHKGGVRAQALVYDDATTPRYVSLLKLEID